HAEACLESAYCGCLKRRGDLLDSGFVELRGKRIAFVERNRAGGNDGPAAGVSGLDSRPALPRRIAAPFPSRVGKLNGRDRALRLHESSNAAKRFDVLIAPDAHVAGRDATFWRHCGRLDEYQTSTAHRTAAQMH